MAAAARSARRRAAAGRRTLRMGTATSPPSRRRMTLKPERKASVSPGCRDPCLEFLLRGSSGRAAPSGCGMVPGTARCLQAVPRPKLIESTAPRRCGPSLRAPFRADRLPVHLAEKTRRGSRGADSSPSARTSLPAIRADRLRAACARLATRDSTSSTTVSAVLASASGWGVGGRRGGRRRVGTARRPPPGRCRRRHDPGEQSEASGRHRRIGSPPRCDFKVAALERRRRRRLAASRYARRRALAARAARSSSSCPSTAALACPHPEREAISCSDAVGVERGAHPRGQAARQVTPPLTRRSRVARAPAGACPSTSAPPLE